ncbi:GNAT family N-acetyltransferase [Vibrio salinus]|uniref:GNAT family N-acetyltransferase n=1 Tax=Vibrio salinus TaxID=2899784 RepID=UPI001E4D21FF|nr:GNAT family N-acetyltransferase [Vibrio salinus]MCE0495366.1 GNAT family N-acetyltransferase [Vibrio salinus]
MAVCIREFNDDDVIPFFDAVRESVSHVSPWLPWCRDGYSIVDAHNWIEGSKFEWKQETDFRFVIYNSQNDEFLGSVAINDIDYINRTATLGYWVRKKTLRKGVAKQASKLALIFAFDMVQLHKIFVDVLPDNIASINVARHFAINPIPENITITFRDNLVTANRFTIEREFFLDSLSARSKEKI